MCVQIIINNIMDTRNKGTCFSCDRNTHIYYSGDCIKCTHPVCYANCSNPPFPKLKDYINCEGLLFCDINCHKKFNGSWVLGADVNKSKCMYCKNKN